MPEYIGEVEAMIAFAGHIGLIKTKDTKPRTQKKVKKVKKISHPKGMP